MEKFYFEAAMVKPKQMESFLQKVEMPVIEDLSFWLLENVGDIFSAICAKEWPQLKYLIIPSTGEIDDKIKSQSNLFPSLSELSINIQDLEESEVVDFITLIQNLAPNLKKLTIQSV